jgi:hypothetical protein
VVDVAITGVCSELLLDVFRLFVAVVVLFESIVYSKFTDVADAGKLDKSI